jgi:hypothetical protein
MAQEHILKVIEHLKIDLTFKRKRLKQLENRIETDGK